MSSPFRQIDRRELATGLGAIGIEYRNAGGELVVVLPGAHLRIGGRDGVSGPAISRLVKALRKADISEIPLLRRLYGKRGFVKHKERG
jgi:hypothetical protein